LRPGLTACRLLGRTQERPGRGYHAEAWEPSDTERGPPLDRSHAPAWECLLGRSASWSHRVQVAGLDAGASRARLPRWSVGAIGLGRSASRSYRVQVAGLDAGASTARLPRSAWEPSVWGALRPGLTACR